MVDSAWQKNPRRTRNLEKPGAAQLRYHKTDKEKAPWHHHPLQRLQDLPPQENYPHSAHPDLEPTHRTMDHTQDRTATSA